MSRNSLNTKVFYESRIGWYWAAFALVLLVAVTGMLAWASEFLWPALLLFFPMLFASLCLAWLTVSRKNDDFSLIQFGDAGCLFRIRMRHLFRTSIDHEAFVPWSALTHMEKISISKGRFGLILYTRTYVVRLGLRFAKCYDMDAARLKLRGATDAAVIETSTFSSTISAQVVQEALTEIFKASPVAASTQDSCHS